MAERLVFVGERPSPLAYERGATWQNGRHAGKTLREALQAAELDPDRQLYLNLWSGPSEREDDPAHEGGVCQAVQELARVGFCVVALGERVSRALTRRGIAHLKLTHPAARGRIRKTELYQAHVREVLKGGTVRLALSRYQVASC